MSQYAPWLLLPLLGLSSCLVPGLELGPAQGGAAGAETQVAGSAGSGGAFLIGPAAAQGGSGGSAGSAGSGGSAGGGGVGCDALPIPPKSKWSVTASSSSLGDGTEIDPLFNPPEHVMDGSTSERWASGQPQEGGQWFHIDFGATAAISEVILQQGTHIDDYPRGYEISLSYRHTDFEAVACASGHGASVSETVVAFDEPVVGRYMLIRQTGDAPRWWTIAEIDVTCH